MAVSVTSPLSRFRSSLNRSLPTAYLGVMERLQQAIDYFTGVTETCRAGCDQPTVWKIIDQKVVISPGYGSRCTARTEHLIPEGLDRGSLAEVRDFIRAAKDEHCRACYKRERLSAPPIPRRDRESWFASND
jgi:hypothetical protein